MDRLASRPKKIERSFGVIPLIKAEGTNKYNVIVAKNRNKKGGYWDFPKGKIETKDASTFAAAIREFQEELGIDYIPELVESRSFKSEYNYITRSGEDCEKTVEFYIGFVKDKELKDFKPSPREIAEIRLVSTDEALTLLSYPVAKKHLRDAVEFLESYNKE